MSSSQLPDPVSRVLARLQNLRIKGPGKTHAAGHRNRSADRQPARRRHWGFPSGSQNRISGNREGRTYESSRELAEIGRAHV